MAPCCTASSNSENVIDVTVMMPAAITRRLGIAEQAAHMPVVACLTLAIRPSSRKNMIRASAGNFRSRRVGMVRNSAKARLEVLQQLP